MEHSQYGYHQEEDSGGNDQEQLVSLQKNLLKVWEEFNVEEYYQNIILSYLDSLPDSQAREEITKQIRETHEGRSLYFRLIQRLNLRKQSLKSLENLVGIVSKRGKVDGQALSGICNQLKSLRDDNLVIAETLIQLHRHYSNNKNQPVSEECRELLINLDEQNKFLRESFLNQFILFQYGYDPFFLHHYDMKGKRTPLHKSPFIDKLFTLGISYACRLFKAKTHVLQMFSSGRFNFSQLKKDKYAPKNYTTLIPLESITIDSRPLVEREFPDSKKQTSVNFRKKTLSLQNAKEKDSPSSQRIKHKNSFKLNNSIEGSPMSNNQKPKYGFGNNQDVFPMPRVNKAPPESQREQSDGEEIVIRRKGKYNLPRQEQDLFKLVPINSRLKRNFKKPSEKNYTQPDEELSERKSFNFKQKLQPIKKSQPLKRAVTNKDEDDSEEQEAPTRKPLPSKQKGSKQSNNKDDDDQQNQSPKSIRQTIRIDGKLNKSDSPSKKEVKMKPGKYTHVQLMSYLKTLKINENIRNNTFLNTKWEQSLSKCQSYVCEFIINNQISVIAISMILPEGDYLIKLWAPTSNCDSDTSLFLFQKYIDYLEKMTSTRHIHYNGDECQQILACQFQLKRERLYSRKRVSPIQSKQTQFKQFLSLRCSNILLPQQSSTSKLFSQQIEAFSEKTSYVAPFIANIDRTKINSDLLMLTKISEEITDMKALNSILQDEDYDTYEVSPTIKFSKISALRLGVDTPFKVPFLAGDGYMKFNGEELFKSQTQLITRIRCEKSNTRLLFGKGFPNIRFFLQNMKKQSKSSCEFSVKMFNKQLYGRIPNEGIAKGSYGNWEISLYWQDELQGRLKHNMMSCSHFGPESFFVGIEIEGELLYCFEVKQQDLLL